MEIRYMKRLNENGQEERFYPITHAKAIVGLSDIPEVSENDLISTETASEIVGDAPEIDPAIIDLVNSLTASDVEALPIQIITCAYGNTDEEIIKGLSENWNKLSNGIGSIQFSNGADIWYGTYYKYTDTIGSILMQNASGAYSKKFIRGNNTLIDLYTKDNKPTAYDLSIPVNNNILINSNFANPVNQRGFVSGSNCVNEYFIDRWVAKANIGLVNNSHITISNMEGYTDSNLVQRIEFPQYLTGRKLTFSIKCRAKKLHEFALYIAGTTTEGVYETIGYYRFTNKQVDTWEEFSKAVKVPSNIILKSMTYAFAVEGSDYEFDIEWMKLEIGDHATPYVPRLYAEEFALCQRYYQKYGRYSCRASRYLEPSDRIFYCYMTYPKMRSNPTVNVESFTLNSTTGGSNIPLANDGCHAVSDGLIQFSAKTSDKTFNDGSFDVFGIVLDAEL